MNDALTKFGLEKIYKEKLTGTRYKDWFNLSVKELLTPEEILNLKNLSEFEFTSYNNLSDYDIEGMLSSLL